MQKDSSTQAAKNLTNVIKINEDQFKNHLGEMVRSTVEETLNDMLDAEADQLCNANPRIFTPVARSSYKWKQLYNKRSSVERVNSRMDESFGFEKHFIRGAAKMKMRCCLAMIVMLGMAYGRIREKQPDKIRSLVQPAA